MTLLPMVADWASWAVLLACAPVLVRMALGPGTADRAVALDMLSVLMAAFAALRAIATGMTAYIDVAAVLTLAAFVATLAFARFLARKRQDRSSRGPA